jgi:branched-chain amino acid aminotransferase
MKRNLGSYLGAAVVFIDILTDTRNWRQVMVLIGVAEVMQSDSVGARLPHKKEYETGSAFINGTYCTLMEASIPLMDGGFLACDAVYEKLTVSNGRYFRLQDHFDRFSRSCAKFRLRNPHTSTEMAQIFDRLVSLTGLRQAGVFWCVTRGLPKGDDDRADRSDPGAFENRFYAFADAYLSIVTPEQRRKGVDLLISETYIRIPPKAVDPTAKSFHWMDMKLSLFEARDHGKDWSVLVDRDGYLTEAPGANIFVIKNGELFTPDCGCLEGITRKTTLELAEMIGVRTHTERVRASQLREADDAFMTSSAGGIMPVNSVDGVVLGGVAGPGELAVRIHNLYWEKMWEGWKSTPVDYEGSSR